MTLKSSTHRKVQLTDEQKKFIEENYQSLTNARMAVKVGATIHYIAKYLIANNLRRKNREKPKVEKMQSKFFDVFEMENWLV